jgi:hypothetical protein
LGGPSRRRALYGGLLGPCRCPLRAGRCLGGRPGRRRPRALAAALGGRPQLRRDVRGHRRGMALHLHAHGGQLGEQVLGRHSKLFGEFVDTRVAQPVLTSSCSLDRGRCRPEASSVLSPDRLATHASRRALRAASTPGAPAAFNARCTLRRLTARAVQAGSPHR